MDACGIRFAVNNPQRFEALRSLYAEIRHDKDAGRFRDPAEWVRLVPDEIKANFSWPPASERKAWLAVRESTPVAVQAPAHELGATWNFYCVFEAIDESEYGLLGSEM